MDKTGDAAIIESDDIIRKTDSFQVETNFHQSKVSEDSRPCEWYKGGEVMRKSRKSNFMDS
jgi:hypothetical protein